MEKLTLEIVLAIVFGLIAILDMWFSIVLASLESAVMRVTRTSLNNRSLAIQSDEDLTDFERARKLKKITRVQNLVASRNATQASASFLRVVLTAFFGVLVALIAVLFVPEWWEAVLIGFVAAIIFGVIALMARPRFKATVDLPIDVMVRHSRLMSIVTRIFPFAAIRSLRKSFREEGDGSLADDEQIEKIQQEESKAMVDRMVETTDVDPQVAEMLRNVVSLSDTLTREIMVPRTDMVCLPADTPLADALKLFSRSGFSRIPVIGDSIDDLRGMAYLKDVVQLLAFGTANDDKTIGSIAREPLLVPESKPVDDLFHQMQQQRQHVAVVFDEYGGIAGIVTIEDAIEQIVGELEDEHDRTQHQEPRQVDEHVWEMPARTPINDLEEIFEIDIDEDDVDTVYGLLTKILGHVPIVGESGRTHGLLLTAIDQAGRRKKVSMLRVQPLALLTHDEQERQEKQESADSADKTDKAEQNSARSSHSANLSHTAQSHTAQSHTATTEEKDS